MKKAAAAAVLAGSVFLSVVGYAESTLCYYKYNNSAIVSVNSTEFNSAVLMTAKYSGGRLVDVSSENIELKSGKYESKIINIDEGIDYKFFVVDSLNSMKPYSRSAALNIKTPNGSSESGDGEYTKPY